MSGTDAYTENQDVAPAATIPPVLTRYNAVRFMPYGNHDNPPTSGKTFIYGDYRLWGVV